MRAAGPPNVLVARTRVQKSQSHRSGHTIHGTGLVVPELVTPDRQVRALVKLVGWDDFGRESTFYSRPDDGRRRYVPNPQPDAPFVSERPEVEGTINEANTVDEAGGLAFNAVETPLGSP